MSAEVCQETAKRSVEECHDMLDGVKVVLLDVEGTTTPISFVKDKLFSYVRENLKSYLETNWEKEELQNDIKALKEQVDQDKEDEINEVVEISDNEDKDKLIESIVENVIWQMDKERKNTSLKQLQGHIWRDAYKMGKVHGNVYDDVSDALKKWKTEEKKVYVYSSGSVEAQKLLYRYSEKGDLSEYVSGYFDLDIGNKVEKDSYKKIAEEVGVKPEEIIFLTDIPSEAKPAVEAGIRAVLVKRDGNAPLTDDDEKTFNTISTFGELIQNGAVAADEAPSKK